MTLGAGDPRSYRGARFPGIPGLSRLSSQSHGPLKVDRQNAHQHVSPPTPATRACFGSRALAGGVVKRGLSLSPCRTERTLLYAALYVSCNCFIMQRYVYTFHTLRTPLFSSFFPVYFVLAIKSNLLITSRAGTFYSFGPQFHFCKRDSRRFNLQQTQFF